MRAVAPLWLAAPTRFAAIPRARARAVLAMLLVLVLASLTALATPGPPPIDADPAHRSVNQADPMLYDAVVEDVRHGGDYYAVAADELRAGGYPLRPFVTFRLPTLAVALAVLPAWARPLLLYLMAALVFVAWTARLRPVFARGPPLVIALTLLAAGMMTAVQRDLATFHDVWAGLFVALSLARRRHGRWVEAVALGLCAVLIRETALLYVGVMLAFAAAEGERREAAGWALVAAVLAGVELLHAHAVAQVVRPLDQASPGWAGLLGAGFFVKALVLVTALRLLPMAAAAPLVVLAALGWAGWREPLAARMLAVLAAYAVLIALAGRTDTFYWAMMAAPASLVGLAFAPDALRDLWRAAHDRRRITVTRITRQGMTGQGMTGQGVPR